MGELPPVVLPAWDPLGSLAALPAHLWCPHHPPKMPTSEFPPDTWYSPFRTPQLFHATFVHLFTASRLHLFNNRFLNNFYGPLFSAKREREPLNSWQSSMKKKNNWSCINECNKIGVSLGMSTNTGVPHAFWLTFDDFLQFFTIFCGLLRDWPSVS